MLFFALHVSDLTHDPLLMIFTYLMVALITICIYLICQGAWHLCKFCMKCKNDVDRHKEEKDVKMKVRTTIHQRKIRKRKIRTASFQSYLMLFVLLYDMGNSYFCHNVSICYHLYYYIRKFWRSLWITKFDAITTDSITRSFLLEPAFKYASKKLNMI